MLIRTAAAFSTLLIIALIALFIRSIYITDLLRYRTAAGGYYEVATIPSQLRISHGSHWPHPQPVNWAHGSYSAVSNSDAVGFHLMRWQSPVTVDHQTFRVKTSGTVFIVNISTIAIPFPSLILLAAMPLALVWGIRRFTRKRVESRKKFGLCITCGYDLRAADARCPECGSVIQAASYPVPV